MNPVNDIAKTMAIPNLFLRGLGLIFLIAFISLWVQVEALIGSEGILPVADYLQRIQTYFGTPKYWQYPTLSWLSTSDWFLHLQCGFGCAFAIGLMLLRRPFWSLLALWILYLSMSVAGQLFFNFQWDILLLEVAFTALFIAPFNKFQPELLLGVKEIRMYPRSKVALWLLWLLLFKLMFLSGIVKLLSKDVAWWNLTALEYHYWSQPLPNLISWYVHQLPIWIHKLSTAIMFFY